MHTSCTKVHRGLLSDHYGYHRRTDNPTPIIDAAFVLMDFHYPSRDYNEEETVGCGTSSETKTEKAECASMPQHQQATMGCLELCMFAEGSRHQEEIVVTGMKGRIEAYLPENKVFCYQRPTVDKWTDQSKPPPKSSIQEEVIDCSELKRVYNFADEIPKHSGYHYCSTAIEWKFLLDAIKHAGKGGHFVPQVSLHDGLCAVEMGIQSMNNITNKSESESRITPIVACSSQSSEHLLNLAINLAMDPQTHAESNATAEAIFNSKQGQCLHDGMVGLNVIDE